MHELTHWHPVLPSKSLHRKPVSVTLCGQDVVLFRTASGTPGALQDRCPHRRMRLSAGWVEGDRLVCPYHGWSYGRDGTGHSPSTPKMHPCAPHFDVVEQHGWLWIKAVDHPAVFPAFEQPGYHLACTLEHRFDAPLELVVDIFAEVEHAPTSHTFFGYALAESAEVEARMDFSAADRIRLLSIAPQRRLPWLVEKLFGIRGGDRFYNQLDMYFSPVYHSYDISWVDPNTNIPRQERLLSVFFFNPIDAARTQCVSFHYLHGPRWGTAVFHLLQKHFLTWIMDHEIKRDQWTLARIASKQTDVAGMCLGRFDRILVEHRRRIQRLYRGQPQQSEVKRRATVQTIDMPDRKRQVAGVGDPETWIGEGNES